MQPRGLLIVQQNISQSIAQYCLQSIIAVMSITIQLEDFQSWSEVFQEIEKQFNMRLFEIIQPNPSATHDREKRKGSLSQVHNGRCFSEREKHHLPTSEVQPRNRSISTPCAIISEINLNNPDILQGDSRFTDAARKLSKEEKILLYQDIVKPVDVYSVFIENQKEVTGRDLK